MNRSLIQIAAFSSAIEAEHVRLLLQRYDIAAFLDGANTGTALSYVGSALGGVKVLVSSDDAARAMEIVCASGDSEGVSGQAWFCAQCREEVDAEFEVCWSCGQPRVDVEQPFPQSSEEVSPAGEAEIEEDASEAPPSRVSPAPIDRNPYASPTARCVPAPTSHEPGQFAPNPEAEEMLDRAWRASIIGFFMVPLVFHCYSMYLLFRASLITDTFSPKGTRQYYRAWAINVFSGLVWGMFFAFSVQFVI